MSPCATVCHCLLSIKSSKWMSWIDITLHFSGLLEILSCHLAVEYVWKGDICISFPDSTRNLEISPPIQPNVLERQHWCLRVSSKCSQMMKHLFNWMLVNENAGFWDAIISPSPIPHCLQLEALIWKKKKLSLWSSVLAPQYPVDVIFVWYKMQSQL